MKRKEDTFTSSIIKNSLWGLFLLVLFSGVFSLRKYEQVNQGDFIKKLQSSDAETIAVIGETAKVIYEDNRFTAFNNGIVRDTKKGHEWIAGPDRPTSLSETASWVMRLNKDKFAAGRWRMPTIKELKTIEGPAISLLKTTDRWVWSGENRDRVTVWFFLFDYNYVGFNTPNLRDYRLRALAVRSR